VKQDGGWANSSSGAKKGLSEKSEKKKDAAHGRALAIQRVLSVWSKGNAGKILSRRRVEEPYLLRFADMMLPAKSEMQAISR